MKFRIKIYQKYFRLLFLVLGLGVLSFLGIFSCSTSELGRGASGTPGGASPGPVTGMDSGAAPQTPPATVSLDPGCEKGAKPTEDCPGSPLPPPLRPCPSNLTVIKDMDAGVWWCACPANTTEVKDADHNNQRSCICASGQRLIVNVDKGEALTCPANHNHANNSNSEEAAPSANNATSAQQCISKMQNYRNYPAEQVIECIEQLDCEGYGEFFCLTLLDHKESFPSNYVSTCSRACHRTTLSFPAASFDFIK